MIEIDDNDLIYTYKDHTGSSADVTLTHIPTGLKVFVNGSRSLNLNRIEARKQLEKLLLAYKIIKDANI